jgi:hypothetical protein
MCQQIVEDPTSEFVARSFRPTALAIVSIHVAGLELIAAHQFFSFASSEEGHGLAREGKWNGRARIPAELEENFEESGDSWKARSSQDR